jgi:hypothetical protein
LKGIVKDLEGDVEILEGDVWVLEDEIDEMERAMPDKLQYAYECGLHDEGIPR